MINADKLRGLIVEKGYSQRRVAQAIGMTEKTFYNKMHTGTFGLDEAERMISLLDIKNPQEIFFGQKVTSQVIEPDS